MKSSKVTSSYSLKFRAKQTTVKLSNTAAALIKPISALKSPIIAIKLANLTLRTKTERVLIYRLNSIQGSRTMRGAA